AAAPGGFDLESVEVRRVVRCGDDDAASRVAFFDGPRDERRRHVSVEERNVNPVTAQDLRRTHRELLGEEATVEAHDNVRARGRVSLRRIFAALLWRACRPLRRVGRVRLLLYEVREGL